MKTVKTITEAIKNAIDSSRGPQAELPEEKPGDLENLEESEILEKPEEPETPEKPGEPGESEKPEEHEQPNLAERTAGLDLGETREDVRNLLVDIAGELEAGEISDTTLSILLRGIDYEQDLARASEEAEIRGRNATIREEMLTEELSDGLPHPGTGHGPMAARRPDNIFDLARGAY